MSLIIDTRITIILLFTLMISSQGSFAEKISKSSVALRVATFNIEDVRSEQLEHGDDPKLRKIAEIIQRIRPNIILLSELAVDHEPGRSNAQKFAELYLSVPQANGLKPLQMNTYTPPTNTGIHSQIDLDGSGTIISEPPTPFGIRSSASNEYAQDCFGYGTFPGQYGMALLVDSKLSIQTEQIRTFQKFLWKDLPHALIPLNADGTAWYSEEAWDIMRLSSKNFVDVPILLPNGQTLHCLISHPTPPAFDGPEQRNRKRNHDEIRLIREYIDNNSVLYDDDGQSGGLPAGETFCILGDLNADPSSGSSIDFVMLSQLLSSPKLAQDVVPSSSIVINDLKPFDTAQFGLRVDYVLPSMDIIILNSGVWRGIEDQAPFPSDHFPVWVEMRIPDNEEPVVK